VREREREIMRVCVKGGYLRVVKVINKLKLTETLPHLPKEKKSFAEIFLFFMVTFSNFCSKLFFVQMDALFLHLAGNTKRTDNL